MRTPGSQGAPLLALFARGGRVNRHIQILRLLIKDCVMQMTLRKPLCELSHPPAPCGERKERGTRHTATAVALI